MDRVQSFIDYCKSLFDRVMGSDQAKSTIKTSTDKTAQLMNSAADTMKSAAEKTKKAGEDAAK